MSHEAPLKLTLVALQRCGSSKLGKLDDTYAAIASLVVQAAVPKVRRLVIIKITMLHHRVWLWSCDTRWEVAVCVAHR